MTHILADFEAQVLDLAGRRAEQAEVYAVESIGTPVTFEANRLKQLRTRQSRGVAFLVQLIGDCRPHHHPSQPPSDLASRGV